ncbi:hypothetical protein K1719_031136 [Acacia pycnantha]|nr:hypothetical protein K1719_031136 [Acacia pycnantha]
MKTLLQTYLDSMAWLRSGRCHIVHGGRPDIVCRALRSNTRRVNDACECQLSIQRAVELGPSFDDLHCGVLKSSLLLKLDCVIYHEFCRSFEAFPRPGNGLFYRDLGILDEDDVLSLFKWRFGQVGCYKMDDISVMILYKSKNIIHSIVESPGLSTPKFISFMYGPPKEEERRVVRDQIRKLAVGMDDSWLLVGDFNDLLSQPEKEGAIC